MRPGLLVAILFSLASVSQAALAVDPGEAWSTESGSGVPPDGVQWLPSASLCAVVKDKLAEAVKALDSRSFAALDAKSLVAYAGTRCKGKYAQLPFLVRAVSSIGEGHLEAGLMQGQVWMRFTGVGGKHPFEKTPVVLWLYAAPSQLHVTASTIL